MNTIAQRPAHALAPDAVIARHPYADLHVRWQVTNVKTSRDHINITYIDDDGATHTIPLFGEALVTVEATVREAQQDAVRVLGDLLAYAELPEARWSIDDYDGEVTGSVKDEEAIEAWAARLEAEVKEHTYSYGEGQTRRNLTAKATWKGVQIRIYADFTVPAQVEEVAQ